MNTLLKISEVTTSNDEELAKRLDLVTDLLKAENALANLSTKTDDELQARLDLVADLLHAEAALKQV